MANLTVRCGSIGRRITDTLNVDLTGIAVTLYLKSPKGTVTYYPMSVNSEAGTVAYSLVGTEFPTAGDYSAQLVLRDSADSELYEPSSVVTITALANISP